MQNWKSCLMATVALASFGIAEAANAQGIYGGGATFPSPVYRQLFDCWFVPVDGNPPVGGPTGFLPPPPINPACPSPTGNASGTVAQILYAPVGSGGGKRAFRNHDCSSSTATGLGTPAAANTVPFVSSILPAYGYPGCHFSGSDDVVIASDYLTGANSYTGLGQKARFGEWLQIPSLLGPVAIAFNPGAGVIVPGNPTPAGGSSGLNLTRRALCGIFSGHITTWGHSELTATNPGLVGNTTPLTVVHRSDGSGTTFLFTNAMIEQCESEFGPNNGTVDPTIVSWQFPWKDDAANLAPARCPDALPLRGANLVAWPDTVPDVCNNVITSPGTFASGSGNAGVVAAIAGTIGAIGYATADFVQPVVAAPTGMPTANLQNQFDIDNVTGLFQPPTAAKAQLAMSEAVPTFNATTRANPLNWSAQMIVKNPVLPDAYPIAGFTMFNFYQCYASAADLNAIFSYLVFHYTRPEAAAIINSQGFATIPTSWFNEVALLLTTGSTAMNVAGSGACASVAPGA
jgi:phosphate transport system substrate-binding protein